MATTTNQQEIITALQNDGFVIVTDEDVDTGIDHIFFYKNSGYGKVDSWIHIENVTDTALSVLRANQEIEYSKSQLALTNESMSENYDEFA